MNWDDDDYEAPEMEPGLKANWDDEDAEEPEPEPEPSKPAETTVKTATKSKKKELEEKIKEKEEREARLHEARKSREQQADLDGLSEVEKKLRRQKIVEEADFEHAQEIFMDGAGAEVPNDDVETIDGMKPKGDAQLKKFEKLLAQKINQVQETNIRVHFNAFIKDLLRDISVDMSLDDVKDISTHVNVLVNEKLQAQKGAQGTKKKPGKKKATVKMERSQVMDAYVDEFDDFM